MRSGGGGDTLLAMSDTKINDGGPAFPVPEMGTNYIPAQLKGMSLRDWFAGQALAGILQTTWYDEDERPYAETGPNIASDAYIIADAMLAARNAK